MKRGGRLATHRVERTAWIAPIVIVLVVLKTTVAGETTIEEEIAAAATAIMIVTVAIVTALLIAIAEAIAEERTIVAHESRHRYEARVAHLVGMMVLAARGAVDEISETIETRAVTASMVVMAGQTGSEDHRHRRRHRLRCHLIEVVMRGIEKEIVTETVGTEEIGGTREVGT